MHALCTRVPCVHYAAPMAMLAGRTHFIKKKASVRTFVFQDPQLSRLDDNYAK